MLLHSLENSFLTLWIGLKVPSALVFFLYSNLAISSVCFSTKVFGTVIFYNAHPPCQLGTQNVIVHLSSMSVVCIYLHLEIEINETFRILVFVINRNLIAIFYCTTFMKCFPFTVKENLVFFPEYLMPHWFIPPGILPTSLIKTCLITFLKNLLISISIL